MACKKCGGGRSSNEAQYPVFSVENNDGEMVDIGAKASLWLEGIANDQVFLRVGNTMRVGNAAAAALKNKGAPIWIL